MQATTETSRLAKVKAWGVTIYIHPGNTPETVEVSRWKNGMWQGKTQEPRSKWAKHLAK